MRKQCKFSHCRDSLKCGEIDNYKLTANEKIGNIESQITTNLREVDLREVDLREVENGV